MRSFFLYNWQVRDEWFEVCERLSHDELVKERIGGVGSFLKTLFHISDVEYSWIRAIEGKEDKEPSFEDYNTLNAIRSLSDQYREELHQLIFGCGSDKDEQIVSVEWHEQPLRYGEVFRHVIAHEIHHIGQLSIWAKEMNIERVSANFIGRGLGDKIIMNP